jgi:hypothetical protein
MLCAPRNFPYIDFPKIESPYILGVARVANSRTSCSWVICGIMGAMWKHTCPVGLYIYTRTCLDTSGNTVFRDWTMLCIIYHYHYHSTLHFIFRMMCCGRLLPCRSWYINTGKAGVLTAPDITKLGETITTSGAAEYRNHRSRFQVLWSDWRCVVLWSDDVVCSSQLSLYWFSKTRVAIHSRCGNACLALCSLLPIRRMYDMLFRAGMIVCWFRAK